MYTTETDSKSPRTLKKVSVRGLFGEYDHDIPRHPTTSHDGVTLLHGQNGVGKTTILCLAEQVLIADFKDVRSVKFDELSILLDDDTEVVVIKVYKSTQIPMPFFDHDNAPSLSSENDKDATITIEQRRFD